VDQAWFEMRELRRRRLDAAVWIPLRASCRETDGKFGLAGYRSEFFGLGSVAIPFDLREQAQSLGWDDIGLAQDHGPWFQDGRYIPSDEFHEGRHAVVGLSLVLSERGNVVEPSEWHLHQDFVIALRLKREADVWLAMDEGYVDVARLRRDPDGTPVILEVRAEHLKDYLCARRMCLYISSYRHREEILEDAGHIVWQNGAIEDVSEGDKFKGYVVEIHEGGAPFGSSAAVFHIGRKNLDLGEDVPSVGPNDENIVSRSWTIHRRGRKLFRVRGEIWRNEWVNSAQHSPRVRGDKLPTTVSFITDSAGTRENADALLHSGSWLWFRPDVTMAVAHRRGGELQWYTRDTGHVRCPPSSGVHFGVNQLGLINVFAKDIALLPDWQQRLWAGYNVGPEGGVSEELLAAQAEGMPAKTQAPEAFLQKAIEHLNEITTRRFGFTLFRGHEQLSDILSRTHRFRSVDQAGFFSLAKDLARLTADSIDATSLQRIVAPPKGEKWGSLKSLEKVVAQEIDPGNAKSVLAALAGIYELRHADAHLASSDLAEAYNLVQVDNRLPFVGQGYQILSSCVTCLYEIAEILNRSGGEGAPPSPRSTDSRTERSP